VLYESSFWSGAFLIFIFSVSVWNGGGFYIEVFGRKFERELEALRKELADTASRSGISTPADHQRTSSRASSHSDDDASVTFGSPVLVGRDLTEEETSNLPRTESVDRISLGLQSTFDPSLSGSNIHVDASVASEPKKER